jgi:hypothetical protein
MDLDKQYSEIKIKFDNARIKLTELETAINLKDSDYLLIRSKDSDNYYILAHAKDKSTVKSGTKSVVADYIRKSGIDLDKINGIELVMHYQRPRIKKYDQFIVPIN